MSVLEDQPQLLLDRKKISLRELIIFELLLEIDALDDKYQGNWAPLASRLETPPTPIFAKVPYTEFHEVIEIWQEAFEWSFYDQVLAGMKQGTPSTNAPASKTFQAMFCMDSVSYTHLDVYKRQHLSLSVGIFGVDRNRGQDTHFLRFRVIRF